MANPQTPGKRRRVPRWAQALLGVVAGLGLAEAAFWARDGGAFPHVNAYQVDPALGVRLRPGAAQRISFGGNPVTSVRVNAQGYRGADWPAPGPEDVLVIGDSQVFGLGVEEEQTFSAALGKELGGAAHVLQAGVPTWGPVEYQRALEELLPARKPKTVVYVVNFVNDAFEAARPNTERHAVWDGWAVRKETAPASVASFPGRELLFRQSHAVFALRQWLHRQGAPERDDRGFASEGTWRDLVGLGGAHDSARALAREETDRRGELHAARARYAARAALAAELRVKLLAYNVLKLSGEASSVYLSSHANPGDIVVPQQGEEGRPLGASVEYIQQAAEMRKRFEEELKRRAAAEPGSAQAKEIEQSLSERDALEARLVEVMSGPVELARAGYPLLGAVEKARATAEAAGARFVLLVLPIDVQVSADEWKKYGREAIDVSKTGVLLDDLVEGARSLGASALDASEALRAAEPGAFLNGDPHLSPKGHAAVGKALAALLREAPPKAKPQPLLRLPRGRSRLPRPAEWDTQAGDVLVHGSDAAHCRTRRIREYLQVRCTRPGKGDPVPAGVVIEQGGHGEALVWTAGETTTLVVPTVPGDELRARFLWSDSARTLVVKWPEGAAAPTSGFESAEGEQDPPAPGPVEKAVCACLEKEKKSCGEFVGGPDEDCLRTYAGDCERLLACAGGWPASPPRCEAGEVNAGAALHCHATCDGAACPAGHACVEKQGAKLCVPEAAARGSRMGAPEGGATAAPVEVSAPAAPDEAAVKAFDEAAGAALGAVAKALERCHLEAVEPGDWFRYEFFDWCEWKEGEVPPALAALDAALAKAKEVPALAAGRRGTVIEQLRLFRDWLDLAARSKQGRGTLALFQDLALAWNAYQPDKARLVAVDPPHVVAQYHEKFGVRHVEYIMESYKGYERHKSYGLPLPWVRGVHGPRLPD